MATVIPYNRELAFEYGASQRLSPLVRRVIARNPSAFTFHGTGTYIVGPASGSGAVAIVDPGPDLPEHIDAVLDAVRGETVSHILVTHTHLDHSPATVAVKAATGAPSYAFGPHGRGGDGGQVEEGADFDFVPDHRLADGESVEGDGWTVEGVHTPGHTSNHMCFALKEENALFPGDHVMGWSTTVVSPPDGDMRAYMASLEKLQGRSEGIYYPTHGAPITDPSPYVAALLAHRHEREEQIIACLADGVGRIPDMVARMYADIDPGLHRAAGRSVLAHLIHMVETGRAGCEGKPGPDTAYRPAD
ncbi:MAG: MBL fold metallo-hydrolase [Alphaproteobacteria bacterium]|nr:MBL fold metallo-hydrolase [Alphaproteobacteria bacterium]MCZ6510668.1 MBL fold metallo-hydrolase [Alphaproteobacteria bacterium]MCZ6590396.1 MBL fold metallo-hydrolase [Alphaproteobacteria bacterium]MCZ6840473.1 MBL fold metallo-hydrolase [Alphaproteobacteria bacterium]